MSDVTGEVLVLDEFQYDNEHQVAVVWMPRPHLLVIQVASLTEARHRHPYEVLGFVAQPSNPGLQRNGAYEWPWPAEGSDEERHLVERVVKTFETAVAPEARTPDRPVSAG